MASRLMGEDHGDRNLASPLSGLSRCSEHREHVGGGDLKEVRHSGTSVSYGASERRSKARITCRNPILMDQLARGGAISRRVCSLG